MALEFTNQAVAAGHQVFSLLRNADHSKDLPSPSGSGSATPIVSSLEESSASQLSDLFIKNKVDTIVFAAGAGGKGGPERTIAVDQEAAIKTFDAVQQSQSSLENFKRFLLVSAVDVRDLNKKPSWYKEEDFEKSKKAREALGKYYDAKYQADLNLHQRTEKGELTFPWFVLRPSTLKDEGGSGKVALGEQKGISSESPCTARLFRLLSFKSSS